MTTPARPARRLADAGDAAGFTTKEIALQISAKLDAYIQAHETRHSAELQASLEARGDATSSAAGRQLLAAVASVKEDLSEHEADGDARFDKLAEAVESHERTIQRLVGAMALIVFLGGGAFILAAIAFIARISGAVL